MTVQISSLLAAAVFTVWIMIHAAGGKFQMNGFYLWAQVPYVFLLVLLLAVGNKSAATRIAGTVSALAVLAFALFMYIDVMFIHVHSTSALIFVFGPAYLLIGGLAVFGVMSLAARVKLGRE